MYCPQCGTQNLDNANYCSGCGSRLRPEAGMVSEEKTRSYAGLWRRFLAYFIDAIILSFGTAVVAGATGSSTLLEAIETDNLSTLLLISALYWLYYALFESSSLRATPGKMSLGIVVTDLNDHQISFGRASARAWSKIISGGLTCTIVFIIAGFTRRKQALHDIIAGTLVVRK